MEAIDVEDNRYSAFDSEGRLLRLKPTTPQVTIEAAEEMPSQANRLRQILIKFLRDTGVKEENLEILRLDQLVTKSLDFKTCESGDDFSAVQELSGLLRMSDRKISHDDRELVTAVVKKSWIIQEVTGAPDLTNLEASIQELEIIFATRRNSFRDEEAV